MKRNKIIFTGLRLILMVSVAILLSCEKERSEHQVTYMVSDAVSAVSITWNEKGHTFSEQVDFQSGEDEWKHSFMSEEGDILYISTRYQDSTGSVKNAILIDGKLFKEGSSANEPEKYLIVSGTIPYEE